MTYAQIKKAIKNGAPLIWKDPDPIEGNDYSITSIELFDDSALIQYGGGSEAEVPLWEIDINII